MILVVIIQLLISYYFIQFFNKYAYDTWYPSYDKVYICRFLQIIIYLLSLIPGFFIGQVMISCTIFVLYDYPYFKSSIRYKKWYKYLFDNPNE